MGILKGIGYLIAAIAVLTVLFFGGAIVLIIGVVLGLVLNMVGLTVFTATSLKAFFSSEAKSSDPGSK